jgi:hypothetical protein
LKDNFHLKEQLAKYAEILKKDSWFAKNFWSDYLWFNYLKLLCNEFKQSPRGVNVPKLIASLVKPQLSSLRRMYNLKFSFIFVVSFFERFEIEMTSK